MVASILVNIISTKQLCAENGEPVAVLQECKLMALHQMVQRFAEIVDRVTWVTPEAPQDDDAVNAVAMLYHNKAHGKCINARMHAFICLFVCLFILSFFSFAHASLIPSIHSRIHHVSLPMVRFVQPKHTADCSQNLVCSDSCALPCMTAP